MPDAPRILLVDDDPSFREVMLYHLEEDGYDVTAAADGAEALEQFERSPCPVVVTNLKMPGLDGQGLLEAIHKRAPQTLVIVITAFGDMPTAVAAMKAGAFDFLPKPCDREHFKHTVRRAVEHAGLRAQVEALRARLGSAGKPLLFRSDAMERVVELADRVAKTDATVLIHGESGTGKELVARRIHAQSGRAEAPWVAVNCSAIPRDLLEAELFGHEKGAFTGADRARRGRFVQASGGTLFLDEIGELPLELQSRLLRTLQERHVDVVGGEAPIPVDVRILAATNRDLDSAVEQGTFREDFYYRLNVVPIHVPPLRERPEDVLLLAEVFLRQASGGLPWEIPDAAAEHLQRLPWRGNARELENLCQRLAITSDERVLDPAALPPLESRDGTSAARVSPHGIELPEDGVSLPDLERAIIERALELCEHNQSRTARFLRIPRHVLLYRIEKFGIETPPR